MPRLRKDNRRKIRKTDHPIKHSVCFLILDIICETFSCVFLFCQNLPGDNLSCSRYNDRVMIINIWQIRTERKMSLVKLSQLTGISKSALSNYENGHRYPSIEQLERIAVALNTSIASLYESPYK